MKKTYLIFLIFLTSILLVWCLKQENKNLSYFKKVWEDTFKNYQNSVTKIPKKWQFDFEISALVAWDKDNTDFWIVNFWEKFWGFSIKLFWEHDFSNPKNASLTWTLRMYLNKRSFWEWDLDVDFSVNSSWTINLKTNNLDENILKVLNIDAESSRTILDEYKKNKWQNIVINSYKDFIWEILSSINDSSKNSPLVQNTKSEESQIIDLFIKDEVFKLLSWQEDEDFVDKIKLTFSPINFSKFLNDVAKILKENKDFSKEGQDFKDYKLSWNLTIKDKSIIDSDFISEIPLSSIDSKTWVKKYDLLISENNFKMPNPEKFDIDLTTLIYSKSKQNNKLQFRLKWLIK